MCAYENWVIWRKKYSIVIHLNFKRIEFRRNMITRFRRQAKKLVVLIKMSLSEILRVSNHKQTTYTNLKNSRWQLVVSSQRSMSEWMTVPGRKQKSEPDWPAKKLCWPPLISALSTRHQNDWALKPGCTNALDFLIIQLMGWTSYEVL